MSILEGMQPLFRQVPPVGPWSTSATFKPSCLAWETTFVPAPEPITIRSNLSMVVVSRVCGLNNFRNFTLDNPNVFTTTVHGILRSQALEDNADVRRLSPDL